MEQTWPRHLMVTARHAGRFTSTAILKIALCQKATVTRTRKISEGCIDFSPDLKYFQVSNKTMFETHLVKDIVYNVEICASSFESRSDVYNFMHRELDKGVLHKLENFSRVKENNEGNVWKLKADRVEECYFLWKTINLFRKNRSLYLLNVKQADVEGKRRSLQELCLESWKLICKLQNKWIHHRCEFSGCTEGYISVDGLEKVHGPMCARLKKDFM